MGFGAKGGLITVAGEGNVGYTGVVQNAPSTAESINGSTEPDSATLTATATMEAS